MSKREMAGPDRLRQMHRIRLASHELHAVRGVVRLGRENSHHIREVLRLRRGDTVRGLADGCDYLLRIEDSRPGEVTCAVAGRLELPNEPAIAVTVCQALTRPERFEYTLQKCTEIGAAAFIPVAARRSIVRTGSTAGGPALGGAAGGPAPGSATDRPAPGGAAGRLLRWRRIVEEAALQSGRAVVPHVYLPTDIDGLAARFAADRPELLLLAYEQETRALGPVLREALDCAGGAGPPRTAAILIGPEGGLEASEAARMAEAGFLPVSLGPRVLRAETAGPVLLTMLLYELGDLGGFVR